jgi:drug/metabolite transporter (DMT)-like permease
MQPYLLLLVAQLAMGSGAIFGRLALGGMAALSVAAWRLGLVALPLLARLLLRLGWRRLQGGGPMAPTLHVPRSRPLEYQMLLAGLLLAAQFAAWVGSLQRLSMGMSTLLVCTAPLWNSLYEVTVQRRRLAPSFWGALVVGLLGLLGMLGVEDAQAGVLLPGQAVLGMGMALLGSLLIAAYLLLMRSIALEAKRLGAYDTLDVLTRVFGWAALVLFCSSLLASPELPNLPPLADRRAWIGLLGMALITQGLGHSLQNHALRHLQASIVGFATLLEPLVAATLGWLCFGEALGWRRAMGGGLVSVALGYAMWITARTAQQADELHPG